MPNVVKHVFKFQEQRRTLFLNLATKDDFGRHRGVVLYGMQATPQGTSLQIGSGALYTHFGTKFYWDVPSDSLSSIDFNTVLLSGNSVLDAGAATAEERPILVGLYAEVAPSIDPGRQPQIEDLTEVDSGTIQFKARVIAASAETGQPLLNLRPIDPVGMDTEQLPQTDYARIDTTADNPPANRSPSGPANTESFQRAQIPLGYLIIGVDEFGVPPTSLGTGGVWNDGIVYVPPDDPWSLLTDFLGHDVLFGRASQSGVAEPAVSLASVLQTPVGWETANGNFDQVPFASPRFGTPAPGSDPDPWATGNWLSTYRAPNFLRDGESLVWQFRRLDYFLRLWMDRTGDQDLVRLIQDGQGSSLDRQAPLAQVLREFTGTESGDNQNTLTWPDDVIGDDNQVLKSGKLLHALQDLANTSLSEGDHHRGAIYALDLGFWHLLVDILGFSLAGRPSLEIGRAHV
mgnify:FL=1